eukprot:3950879-Pleurochrysis_carterae.AAC.1
MERRRSRFCLLCASFLLQITTTVPTKLALQSASTPLAASRRRLRCHDETASKRSLTRAPPNSLV